MSPEDWAMLRKVRLGRENGRLGKARAKELAKTSPSRAVEANPFLGTATRSVRMPYLMKVKASREKGAAG